MHVLKFTLFDASAPGKSSVVVPLSKDARILSIKNQRQQLTLWVLDHKEGEKQDMVLDIIETGQEYEPSMGWYLGTATFHHMADDDYVMHVFLRGSPDKWCYIGFWPPNF